MFAGGCPGDGRWREVSRGVGDAAPCGLPGNGRQREPAPHPALRGHLPPRGKARAVVGGGGRFRGASGTPPPSVCPGMGGDGSLPLIRPCGATFPQGGRQRLLLAAAQGFAGRRGRRALRFAREWAAAGACPSSGPAGPPSPKGEGKGCCWRRRKVSRGVGDAAPYGFPGKGRRRDPPPSSGPAGPPSPKGEGKGCCWRRKVAAGWGHPALRFGIWKRPRGLRGHPFPDRRTVGAGHARPGGLRGHPSMVRSVGRGLDPSAGVGGSGSLRGA